MLLIGLVACRLDFDDDGFPVPPDDIDRYDIAEDDCDDRDATVHPGADELCADGIDQNCDGDDLACWSSSPQYEWTVAAEGSDAGATLIVVDLNQDGVDEVVAGAPSGGAGGIWWIAGSDAFEQEGGVFLAGDDLGERAGLALVGGGLANDELVVGAPARGAASGRVYVLDGAPTGGALVDQARAIVDGDESGSWFGASVGLAGSRVVVGAPFSQLGGSFAGAIYVFDEPSGTLGLDDADLVVVGAGPGDELGLSVVAIDVDDDGVDEILATGGPASADTPSMWAFSAEGTGEITSAEAAFTWTAREAHAGQRAVACDSDADGTADLALQVDVGDGTYRSEVLVGPIAAELVLWRLDPYPSDAPGLACAPADDVPGDDLAFVGSRTVLGRWGGPRSTAVAIGDVDGDQHADVIIAVPASDGSPSEPDGPSGVLATFLGADR